MNKKMMESLNAIKSLFWGGTNDAKIRPPLITTPSLRCTRLPFDWNEAKRRDNLAKHGVDFDLVYEFDWDTAIIHQDIRKNYQEARFQAVAPIGDRIFFMVFTVRGNRTRIISLRKANNREIRRYAIDIKTH